MTNRKMRASPRRARTTKARKTARTMVSLVVGRSSLVVTYDERPTTNDELQSFEDRPDQLLRHADRAERLGGLHRAVVVGAAGEHLAAEARHVRVRLARGVVDVGMEDLHAVDAGV